MAAVDELLIRLKTEFDTKGIKITEQELKKMVGASKEAAAATENLEKKVSRASLAFAKKQVQMKNATDAITSNTLATSGLGNALGGTIGKIFQFGNQLENLEFQARKTGTSLGESFGPNLIKNFVGVVAIAQVLSIGFTALAAAAKFAITSAFEQDKSLQALKTSLENVKKAAEGVLTAFGSGFLSAFKGSTDGVNGLASAIKAMEPAFKLAGAAASLFFAPLIQGMEQIGKITPVLESLGIIAKDAANELINTGNEVLAFTTKLLNSAVAMAKKLGADITQAQLDADQKVLDAAKTSEQLLKDVQERLASARMDAADKAAKGEAEIHAALMKTLIAQEADLKVKIEQERKSGAQAANKAQQAEAKKHAAEMEKIYKAMNEGFKKSDDEAYANFKINWDKRDRDVAEFGSGFAKFGKIAKENGKALEGWLESVAGPAQFQDYIDNLQEAADANRDFADAIRDSGYELKKQKFDLMAWGDVLQQIGSEVGGVFGGIVDSFGQGMQAFQQIMDETGSGLASWVGAIGTALQGIGQAVGGATGSVLTAIGNIGTAFAAGFAVGGPIGGAIAGGLAGIMELFKAFGKDWEAEARKMAAAVGFAISDELAKAIGELGKTTAGGTDTAIELMLRNIIDEIGVTESTIGDLLSRARDLFSFLQRGQLTTAQVGGVLNDIFADLAAGAEKFGSAYQAQLIEIIALSKQFGIEVQAITDYVNAQFNAVAEAVNGLAGQLDDLIAKLSRDLGDTWLPDERELNVLSHRFNEVANSVVAAFNAMFAQGMSLSEIFAQLGPSLESLQAAAERFGLTGSEAFQKLMEQFKILEKLAPKIARLEFFTNLNAALANVGKLTEKEFKKLENVTKNAYKQMIKGGMDSKQALQQIVPSLKEIIREHELLGTPIDKNTQKLIDQARAAGLLEDEDPTETLIKGFEKLNTTMETFVKAIAKALGLTLDLADAADDVDYGDGPAMPPGMGGRRDESRNPGRQHIRVPHIVTHAGPVVLHPGESVHPGSYKDVPAPSLAATGSVSVNFNGGVQTMFFKSKEEFRDFIVDSVKRARNAGSFRNNG